ncbi:helix-turn-helix transcriptional regulator [Pyxidicoccus parkwayensis]|uniref:Helix-turn-helix transcriptional regulator n=1 Tax=Pyxidicoccus parkwayensis TaxID=2813578 RepID=A0ABX7NS86_9BACT|nr:TetR/AcrR family transcriptional regulator [Pyxidicoccus parkwaysis]QSQ20410.1 helix-turn-helix transcriptional regulator [Pyxidicoccus parkwaysis]
MWLLEQMHADTMAEAAGLMALRGYDNVHASELATATRMSVGTLYRRYGSKRGFALAVRDFAENTLCHRARVAFECTHASPELGYRQAFFDFWSELVSEALREPGLFAFTFLHWHPYDSGPHARYAIQPYMPRSLGPIPSGASEAYAPTAAEPDTESSRASGDWAEHSPRASEMDAPGVSWSQDARARPDARKPEEAGSRSEATELDVSGAGSDARDSGEVDSRSEAAASDASGVVLDAWDSHGTEATLESHELHASNLPGPRAPRALGYQSHGRAARALVREVLKCGEREGALAPGSARVGEGLVWGALVELVRAPAEEGALVTEAEVLAL